MIESKRLVFRQMDHNDFIHAARMLQDLEVMYAWEHAFTDEEVHAWIDRRMAGYETHGYDYFLAVHKETGEVVGQMGLLAEEIEGESCLGIGYILNKDHWRQGYALEGAAALMDYAFDVLKAERVICDIRPQNKSSIVVAKGIGMVQVGEFVKHYNGKDMPHLIFEKRR